MQYTLNMHKHTLCPLQDTLDDMGTRMEGLRQKWDKESQLIEQKNRQVLLEFGVSHDDL